MKRRYLRRWSPSPHWYEDYETWVFQGRWTWIYNSRLRLWSVVTDSTLTADAMRRPGGSILHSTWGRFRQAVGRRAWLVWFEDLVGWRPVSRWLDRRWEPPEGYQSRRHEPMYFLGGSLEGTKISTE